MGKYDMSDLKIEYVDNRCKICRQFIFKFYYPLLCVTCEEKTKSEYFGNENKYTYDDFRDAKILMEKLGRI